MTDRFYTEQRLNRDMELKNFQSGIYRDPLDIIHVGSLPSPLGATTLPPMGAFSTATDVRNLRTAPTKTEAPPVPLVTPLFAAAALVLAYLAFMPMSGL